MFFVIVSFSFWAPYALSHITLTPFLMRLTLLILSSCCSVLLRIYCSTSSEFLFSELCIIIVEVAAFTAFCVVSLHLLSSILFQFLACLIFPNHFFLRRSVLLCVNPSTFAFACCDFTSAQQSILI